MDMDEAYADEPEAKELALSAEMFTNGSLNTFAKRTNVNTKSRIKAYDIRELGNQLMPERAPTASQI